MSIFGEIFRDRMTYGRSHASRLNNVWKPVYFTRRRIHCSANQVTSQDVFNVNH